MILPKAKTDNIVVQELKCETLVYDLSANQAFCLNETAAKVFNVCDGVKTFAELKEKHQFTDEIIYLALDGLKKEKLIADDYVSPFAGLSRREIVRKVGLASLIVLPVISGLVAPTAAHAASTCGQTCTGPGICSTRCARCIGQGFCFVGDGASCTNIGGSCTASNSGFCINVATTCSVGGGACTFGLPCGPNFTGTCQVTGPGTCSAGGGSCTGFLQPCSTTVTSTCSGTGICQA